MGERRPTIGQNWRVREAVGIRAPRQRRTSEVIELLDRGDPDDFERIIQPLQAEDAREAAN